MIVVVEEIRHEVVDGGEVGVVVLAVRDLAPHRDDGIVDAGLVAQRERRERDVDEDVAQPEVLRDRRHRGRDVGGAGTVRQQHLAHAQGEVERSAGCRSSRSRAHSGAPVNPPVFWPAWPTGSPTSWATGTSSRCWSSATTPTAQGQIVGTLVRREAPANPIGAVLYVHGFTDYFFQTALADFFTERGFAFFALDLRKCGRSRRPGQTPHYVSDLAYYDAELSRALAAVRHETGDAPVLLAGHSTGGLVLSAVARPAQRRRPAVPKGAGISGLVLNSPWSSTCRASRGCGAGAPSCSA